MMVSSPPPREPRRGGGALQGSHSNAFPTLPSIPQPHGWESAGGETQQRFGNARRRFFLMWILRSNHLPKISAMS